MCCFHRADANRVQADEYDPIMEKLKKDIRELGRVEHVNHGDLVSGKDGHTDQGDHILMFLALFVVAGAAVGIVVVEAAVVLHGGRGIDGW